MFSVVTSVYKNDKPEFVALALDSMLIHQTLVPDEVILIQDGPVNSELTQLLYNYEQRFPTQLKVIRQQVNQGLGKVLNLGVQLASNEIIARMDSDDICCNDRFEKQYAFLKKHPEVDIVGGQIQEFIDSPSNIIGKRNVPLCNNKIYEYMKSRCAFNHVTVMFRKQSVLTAGNYQDWLWNEDYYLWIRMMMHNAVFANISDTLVYVRGGSDMYQRRGGKKYYKSEKSIQRLLFKQHFISYPQYLKNIVLRYILQRLMPNSFRGWIYRHFARQ